MAVVMPLASAERASGVRRKSASDGFDRNAASTITAGTGFE